jgi:predicted ATPase
MKRIKLSNFRKIKDTWELDLAPITFFTGTNNSGKSTVIKSILLLEDYVKSNNHLELNFHGENFYKHKIESFKNAINRSNLKNDKRNILFEYQNNGYEISVLFQISERYQGGTLKNLKIVRLDKATFEMNLISSKTYQLQVDALLFNQIIVNEQDDEIEKLKTLDLFNTTSTLIDIDSKKVVQLEKEVENHTNETLLIELGDESSYKIDGISDEEKPFLRESILENHKKNINEKRKKIFDLKQSINDAEKKLKILQKKRNEIAHQNKDLLKYSPTFSIDDFDSSNRRIDKIIRTVLPKYLVDNNLGNKRKKNDFKNSDESLELDKANKLGDELLSALSFSVKHLSPHRSSQNKLFIHENKDLDINYYVKNYSEKELYADLDIQKFISKWMSKDYFDIGKDYRITTYESTVSKVEILENGTWINLSDKGFGAGQVFAILLAISASILETLYKLSERGTLFEKDLSIILIEEPEANLHPKLQSKLAELFLDANKSFGISFILETHSEYLIRKSQLLSIENNFFKLYYFDKDNPYEMEYLENGKFNKSFGEGFTDVADSIEIELYKKNLKRK